LVDLVHLVSVVQPNKQDKPNKPKKWRGNQTVTGQPDAELDLRGVICPYNFVKTKLKLEAMEQGQILSVLLDDGDPIGNVPRSVSNEGHTILSQDLIEGSYRVLIRRREDE
jgi:tRNA 2-thiouridine synthesizing protein A